ncbi:MAG: outer membrane protein assembly factor BamD [Candidatus Zixiibacteriota bacterium]|nr:MAG: outer membrane protein assembly factor BamD [candidate division Zixibacteria bacterium]
MKRQLQFVLLFISAVILASCSGSGLKKQATPREQYDYAMEEYNKNKFFKAQMAFQRLIFSFPGQTFIDTAQYHLGMSFYKMKHYPEAVTEFRRLLSSYPTSPFADDAQFQVAICFYDQSPKYYLDQSETYDAIDEFSLFLTRYPRSPRKEEAQEKLNELYDKLAKKVYKNGELYLKMHDYEPALIYFEQVRDNYPNTEWAKYAFYNTGVAMKRQGRISDALETFQNFVLAFPDHKLSKKARENISEIQSITSGG